MSEKNKGNFRKISEKIFMSITRKKAKERINKEFKRYIDKKEKEIGGTLTQEEIKSLRKDFINTKGKEIRKEEARKARVKATALAFAATLGIGGAGGYALGTHDSKIPGITAGRTTIEVDMNQIEKDVEIENVLQQEKEDKHSLFVKELQDSALNKDVEYVDELKKEVKQEIEQLKTPEEVLNYTKQMYVDRYNSVHEEQIGIENVRLNKEWINKVFYKDKAQNGDKILRQCTEYEAKEMGIPIDGDYSEISVTVITEKGAETESVAYHDDKFVTVYDKDENVLANKETILCELGNVVLQGIDRSTSMNEENTSKEIKEIYKKRFVEAVVDYKKFRGEKTTENNKVQAEQSDKDGIEPGDD